jgi:hypothetical protein
VKDPSRDFYSEIHGPVRTSRCRLYPHKKPAISSPITGKTNNQTIRMLHTAPGWDRQLGKKTGGPVSCIEIVVVGNRRIRPALRDAGP